MNNNIFNIGLKVVVAIIILIGSVMTVGIVQGGNPSAYDDQDIQKLGQEVAIEQGKSDELTQAELDRFILEEGLKIKEQREKEVQESVDSIMNFTFYLLGAVVVVLLLGTLLSVAGDFKKYLVGIISTVAFLILLYAIYASTGSEVPEAYVAMENVRAADDPAYVKMFTEGNWKMVSAAYTTSVLLIGVAILAWIAGAVMKIVK
ncbi:MAG: hypothetical protein N4A35_12545 [Flavobacteriales bacterium]|jgi:hypothetical protein|nr:hypothetical protein [Flavobacteriales bacterium]